MILSVSMLSADFCNLQREIEMVNASEADWLHLDIMDGVFVPNITIGMPVVQQMKKHAHKPLDVHLMIVNPEKYITAFAKAGADYLTVHAEVCHHLHRTVYAIKDEGMKAGVCINPHTPVQALEEIIADTDLILIMSVNPGFGGQKFIQSTYKKIEKLKNLVVQKNSKALIEVDGGVNLETGDALLKHGADILVAGNFIFNSTNPSHKISQLKKLTN